MARAQIALNMHRIAKVISAMHIALRTSLVLFPYKAQWSGDSHHGMQKHIASRTCIPRFCELRPVCISVEAFWSWMRCDWMSCIAASTMAKSHSVDRDMAILRRLGDNVLRALAPRSRPLTSCCWALKAIAATSTLAKPVYNKIRASICCLWCLSPCVQEPLWKMKIRITMIRWLWLMLSLKDNQTSWVLPSAYVSKTKASHVNTFLYSRGLPRWKLMCEVPLQKQSLKQNNARATSALSTSTGSGT